MTPDENTETPTAEQYWVKKCLEYRPSILRIHYGESMGTGWIAAGPNSDNAFLVVTAKHVLQVDKPGDPIDELILNTDDPSAPEIVVKIERNAIIENDSSDVAIIRVDSPPPGPPLPLLVRESNWNKKMKIMVPPLGIDVGWIGFAATPCAVFRKPTITFCRGRISAVGKKPSGQHRFLLDGNINQGMSGGPVWDSYGNVIGIFTEIFTPEVGTPHGGIVPIGYVWDGLKLAGAYPQEESSGVTKTPPSLEFDDNPNA